MARTSFDYQGAKEAGYSDDEISTHLGEIHKDFDYQGALKSGYSPQEINEYLSTYQPERSLGEQAGRAAQQFGLGVAQSALLPYELGAAHLAQPEAQEVAYRENLFNDIERLQEQKNMGQWDQQDEALMQNLLAQVQNPELSKEFIQTGDIGVKGITEKLTGQDLHPEGMFEKSAEWLGFLKDPKKIIQAGLNPKQLLKTLAPSGGETLRSLGAGTALEIAEQGELGPIGTLAAAVVGDAMGGGAAGLIKGGKNLITKPKETLAKVTAKFTPKEKLNLQKELINDFRESGLQADIGTITDSNMLKWMQSRMAQSGLVGKDLDKFKEQMTEQFREQYRKLAGELGEARFASNHEAGEIVKQSLKDIRDADLKETRNLYQKAEGELKDDSFVNPKRVLSSIEKLEKQLMPGSIKSTEQQSVLNALEKIKRDVTSSEGEMMFAKVKDLINDKLALNDIINYEVQGGAKQLLKEVVGELDRAIISHGRDNPSFAKNYVNANKRFSQHAKTFRNRSASKMLNIEDPAQLVNRMNSVQGIRNLDNILSKTPNGREVANNLKRLKLDQVIGDNLVNSTTDQIKLGTFSKLLEKGKNREVIKEILGTETFKRLEKLQNNAGKLAEAADKYFNASKSGVVGTDVAIMAKALNDISHLLLGNPWPLMKTAGGMMAARKLGKYFADSEFLKMVEEIIIASEKGTEKKLIDSVERLRPYILETLNQQDQSE